MKHYIWTSEINFSDWEDIVREDCEEMKVNFDEVDDFEKHLLASDINWRFLEDEQMNLEDVVFPNGIVAYADVERWDKTVKGYKECGNSVSDCLHTQSDIAEWYVDSHGVFRGKIGTHDGNMNIVYRAWKDGVTDEQKKDINHRLCCDRLSERTLRRYTKNIGEEIANVYGWNVNSGRKKF